MVQTFLTEANGRVERDAAMLMVETIPGEKRVTLAGHKNYDTQIGPRTSWNEHHLACGAEQYEPQERGGSTDHAARRV